MVPLMRERRQGIESREEFIEHAICRAGIEAADVLVNLIQVVEDFGVKDVPRHAIDLRRSAARSLSKRYASRPPIGLTFPPTISS